MDFIISNLFYLYILNHTKFNNYVNINFRSEGKQNPDRGQMEQCGRLNPYPGLLGRPAGELWVQGSVFLNFFVCERIYFLWDAKYLAKCTDKIKESLVTESGIRNCLHTI